MRPDDVHPWGRAAAATLALVAGLALSLTLAQAARSSGRASRQGTGVLTVTQQAVPPLVAAGAPLTYTLTLVNEGPTDLHATVTDTLPAHVVPPTDTTTLSGNRLVWQAVITTGGQWRRQVVVTVSRQMSGTVLVGYAGPLTNAVQVTTQEGPTAAVTLTTWAALTVERVHLPLLIREYPLYTNVLRNPGFEGIGRPLDNDYPNPDNWTQETFNGQTYNEIMTPEGWVTWWDEGGEYRRPEARVIPREPPYSEPPVRIYQGYYAAMYFTFYGRHDAGYYQRVTGLTPGASVYFYAHAHAWSCDDDEHDGYSCGNPENQGFRVGIDPHGGVNPWSAEVVWSERLSAPDVYRRIGPVWATVGPEGAVTVFVRSDVQWWPYKHSDAYWDNAALMVRQE